MNKTNLEGFRRILEVKRAELLSRDHDTEDIAVEIVPDSMEECSLEVQRNMAADALSRKAALLCQVTEALKRIAMGRYGVCLECEKPISPKRLAAIPWAALCLECQQAAENRLDADANACMGLRLGYSASDHGEQLADSSRVHDRQLRRPVIPRESMDRGATKSEARP